MVDFLYSRQPGQSDWMFLVSLLCKHKEPGVIFSMYVQEPTPGNDWMKKDQPGLFGDTESVETTLPSLFS